MTTSAVLPTAAPRVLIALLAALALVVAVVLLSGLASTPSDSAGASWNKSAGVKSGASWN